MRNGKVCVFVCEHMCERPSIYFNTKVLNTEHDNFKTVFAICTFTNTY